MSGQTSLSYVSFWTQLLSYNYFKNLSFPVPFRSEPETLATVRELSADDDDVPHYLKASLHQVP